MSHVPNILLLIFELLLHLFQLFSLTKKDTEEDQEGEDQDQGTHIVIPRGDNWLLDFDHIVEDLLFNGQLGVVEHLHDHTVEGVSHIRVLKISREISTTYIHRVGVHLGSIVVIGTAHIDLIGAKLIFVENIQRVHASATHLDEILVIRTYQNGLHPIVSVGVVVDLLGPGD